MNNWVCSRSNKRRIDPNRTSRTRSTRKSKGCTERGNTKTTQKNTRRHPRKECGISERKERKNQWSRRIYWKLPQYMTRDFYALLSHLILNRINIIIVLK
jgi:hypothetical protein